MLQSAQKQAWVEVESVTAAPGRRCHSFEGFVDLMYREQDVRAGLPDAYAAEDHRPADHVVEHWDASGQRRPTTTRCSERDSDMSSTRLTVGDPAPAFELPDVDGAPVRLEPEEHAASVVVFTANGCPFARAWHDRIQRVATDYADRGVVVLQLVSNDDTDHPEDSLDAMAKRVAAGELAGPFLRDAEQVGRAGLRRHGHPGGLRRRPRRARPLPRRARRRPRRPGRRTPAWLREALDDVLAGRDVRRPSTSPAGCSMKWRVDLLWWDGCPTHGQAAELLRDTLAEMGREDVHVVERQVRTREEAERLGFPGSPTFAVGLRDLFPNGSAPALTCRVYDRGGRSSPLPDGTDLAERLRGALARPWDLPGWVDPRKPSKQQES